MRSKVVQRLMNQMEKDPWHVKLKRWYNLEKWVLICRTRKYWDKQYQNYIWEKRKYFIMTKFKNRLLFTAFLPIMVLIIILSTILVFPYWLITGCFIYNTTFKINNWWWNLKTK